MKNELQEGILNRLKNRKTHAWLAKALVRNTIAEQTIDCWNIKVKDLSVARYQKFQIRHI